MNYKNTPKLIKNYIFYIFFFSSPNKIKRKQLKNETEKYLLQEKDKVLFVHRVYKPSKKSNVFFYIFFFSLYSLTSFLAPYIYFKPKYWHLLWAFNFFLFYILYIIRRYSTLFFSKNILCLVFAIEHVLIINFDFIANALFCKKKDLPEHFETLKKNAGTFILSDFISVLMFSFLYYKFFIKFYLKTGPKNIWEDFVNYLFAFLHYACFLFLFSGNTWVIGSLLGFSFNLGFWLPLYTDSRTRIPRANYNRRTQQVEPPLVGQQAQHTQLDNEEGQGANLNQLADMQRQMFMQNIQRIQNIRDAWNIFGNQSSRNQ